MAIFLTEQSKVIVQGLTGSEGMKHGRGCCDSGTNVVGGVNPRKAGQSVELADASVPVFGTVAEAMAETGADVTVSVRAAGLLQGRHRRGGRRRDRARWW